VLPRSNFVMSMYDEYSRTHLVEGTLVCRMNISASVGDISCGLVVFEHGCVCLVIDDLDIVMST
jgi:hypothetical protein